MSRILLDPAARIGFTPTPDDPLGAVQALMARFSDGDDHERRRRIAVDLLERVDPAEAGTDARTMTGAWLDGCGPGVVDAMDGARRIPLEVVARSIGLDPEPALLEGIAALCGALAPRREPLDATARATLGATSLARLQRCLGDADGGGFDEGAVNRLALLFQTHDATAAMVGISLAARLGLDRARPPVRSTTRVVDAERVTVELDDALAFGAGVHRCPGHEIAFAIADAVAATIAARVVEVLDLGPFEARPNLWLRSRFVVQVA